MPSVATATVRDGISVSSKPSYASRVDGSCVRTNLCGKNGQVWLTQKEQERQQTQHTLFGLGDFWTVPNEEQVFCTEEHR